MVFEVIENGVGKPIFFHFLRFFGTTVIEYFFVREGLTPQLTCVGTYSITNGGLTPQLTCVPIA